MPPVLNQAAALAMAQAMMPEDRSRYAVRLLNERYWLVKHQNS